MRNKKGFSLVELAIGLAVVTVLVLGVSISSGLRDSAKIQSATNSVNALRTAAESYLANGNLNYSAVSIANLKTDNLLPVNFDPVGSNPWGGNFTVAVNASDSSRFNISLTGLNAAQATKLTNYFTRSAASTYDATNKIWTSTF